MQWCPLLPVPANLQFSKGTWRGKVVKDRRNLACGSPAAILSDASGGDLRARFPPFDGILHAAHPARCPARWRAATRRQWSPARSPRLFFRSGGAFYCHCTWRLRRHWSVDGCSAHPSPRHNLEPRFGAFSYAVSVAVWPDCHGQYSIDALSPSNTRIFDRSPRAPPACARASAMYRASILFDSALTRRPSSRTRHRPSA